MIYYIIIDYVQHCLYFADLSMATSKYVWRDSYCYEHRMSILRTFLKKSDNLRGRFYRSFLRILKGPGIMER